MPTLSTPTHNDRLLARGKTPGEDRFWAHFGPQPSGKTLIRESGTWTDVAYPLQSRLAAADEIRDHEGNLVKGYFLGGHVAVISDEIADELDAAGYGAYVSA